MMVYLFDGSFEGMITGFYHALKNKETPSFVSKECTQQTFFSADFNIITDMSIYQKMETYLSDKCTFECFDAMYKAFQKDDEVLYDQLFFFMKTAMKHREQTLHMRTEDRLCQIINAKLTVEREAHKMTGFLRFQKLDDQLLYAEYAPTNNITSLISHYFTERYRSFHFMIFDVKRRIYAIYNQKICLLGHYNKDRILNPVMPEDEYKHFFRTYHSHIAIPDRKNLKLQMNFVPKKYWDFMFEMANNE